jgi:hypothetical protein
MNLTSGGILVVGVLTVESTRADGSERPVLGTTDTVQFWITSTRSWKIRTLAIDHDLIAWDLGDLGSARDDPVEFAQQHIDKHYADVLRSVSILQLTAPHDADSSAQVLQAQALAGALQCLAAGDDEIWIWSPDGGDYGPRASE